MCADGCREAHGAADLPTVRLALDWDEQEDYIREAVVEAAFASLEEGHATRLSILARMKHFWQSLIARHAYRRYQIPEMAWQCSGHPQLVAQMHDSASVEEFISSAAAARAIASVGDTQVQLGEWTSMLYTINNTEAARFDLELNVMPGHNVRFAYAAVTIRLDDTAMRVLELGPRMVEAKDPVVVRKGTGSKWTMEVKVGHAPYVSGGVSGAHTSNVSHEGKTYPCRVVGSVAGLDRVRYCI